jgi:flavin-dependent dehydrogenase
VDCDVIVAGGGPGGSAASSALRKLGRNVILLEKTRHPRFHIGESLLPFTMPLLRRIGFMPTMERAGFVVKLGSRFCVADGSVGHTFYFQDGITPGEPGAYQVTRSRFDHLLLLHSQSLGTDVREEHTVKDVVSDRDGVTVAIAGPQGEYSLRARFFIDATGRDTLLAGRTRGKRMDPVLRKVAVFAHFTGARRDEGRDAGNTISTVIRDGWTWWIPLENGITSVGVVIEADRYKRAGMTPEQFLHDTLAAVPPMHERLANATRVSEVHVTSDFSYHADRLFGDRYVIVGDAGFFLDPIFSSGVHLAISSGIRAADAVHDILAGAGADQRLRRYERETRHSQKTYLRFIYGWYQPGFLELFLSPTRNFKMLEAITSILAGAVTDWRVRARMWVFFLLVRINQRVPLAPAINRQALPPFLDA